VVPKSTKTGVYTGRALKSIKDESVPVPVVQEEQTEELVVSEKMAVESNAVGRVDSKINPSSSSSSSSSSSASSHKHSLDHVEKSPRKKKMKIAEDESTNGKSLVPAEPETNVIQHANSSLVVANARPNTAYIYCPSAQQVVPANRGNPETIALLIPSNVLNASLENRLDTSLLEVSCSVLNLHMWPLSNRSTSTP